MTVKYRNDQKPININTARDFSASTLAARALEDKKADAVNIINLTQKTVFADAFVVATATSTTHAQALAKIAFDALQQLGLTVTIQGEQGSDWLVVDASDVVVHIFCNGARELYNLEKLWSDDAGWQDESIIYDSETPDKLAS